MARREPSEEPLEYAVLDALHHVPPMLAQRMMQSLQSASNGVDTTEKKVGELQEQLKTLDGDGKIAASTGNGEQQLRQQETAQKIATAGISEANRLGSIACGLGLVACVTIMILTGRYIIDSIVQVSQTVAENAMPFDNRTCTEHVNSEAEHHERDHEASTELNETLSNIQLQELRQLSAEHKSCTDALHKLQVDLEHERKNAKLEECDQGEDSAITATTPDVQIETQPQGNSLPGSADVLQEINRIQLDIVRLQAELVALNSRRESCIACLSKRSDAGGCLPTMSSAASNAAP